MTGTRDDIQSKLLEFLLNLKYYSTRWERALLYSEMAGFMTAEMGQNKSIRGQTTEKIYKPDEKMVNAARGLNNVEWEDVSIPAMDIYLQEFFMYAYSFITKDRKSFLESTEGRTYIRTQVEAWHTKKIFDLLYGDLPRDLDGWQKKIKQNIKKIKVNELDD